jgi:hypothetical protein
VKRVCFAKGRVVASYELIASGGGNVFELLSKVQVMGGARQSGFGARDWLVLE